MSNSRKHARKALKRAPGKKSKAAIRNYRSEPNFSPVQAGSVSPMRTVPSEISRPEYALTGKLASPKKATLVKTADEIERMRAAGKAAAEVLDTLADHIRPGITTDELDAIAHETAIAKGAYPSPLNYMGYPKSLCTSVNEVICHGIPDSRQLAEGDIINCDVTVFLNGMHGDTSRMFLVGSVDDASRLLVERTHDCMMRGISTVGPGIQVREIGRAIQAHAESFGYGVVRDFVGHGIGDTFHELPNVPHYDSPQATLVLVPGMTFTIEPMINIGTHKALMWDDDWTAVTADGSRSAQFEHTVLVTDDGVEILTPWPKRS